MHAGVFQYTFSVQGFPVEALLDNGEEAKAQTTHSTTLHGHFLYIYKRHH
jgi:hypothetical protein